MLVNTFDFNTCKLKMNWCPSPTLSHNVRSHTCATVRCDHAVAQSHSRTRVAQSQNSRTIAQKSHKKALCDSFFRFFFYFSPFWRSPSRRFTFSTWLFIPYFWSKLRKFSIPHTEVYKFTVFDPFPCFWEMVFDFLCDFLCDSQDHSFVRLFRTVRPTISCLCDCAVRPYFLSRTPIHF